MLSKLEVYATIPASDLNRAKEFYSQVLGFKPESESPGGIIFRCKTSRFFLYPTQFAGTAKNTLAAWETGNIEKEVAELRSRGVKFEDYDYPELKTVHGIATMGATKAAWFKDSEGNILGITQPG
ncbi:MAG: VOC family protein [Spirochaetia bacterium]|jgi:catechol 2,3-dioxygenase-like lactoylglutathione lyase family enzyme